jgi:hypothetical protein
MAAWLTMTPLRSWACPSIQAGAGWQWPGAHTLRTFTFSMPARTDLRHVRRIGQLAGTAGGLRPALLAPLGGDFCVQCSPGGHNHFQSSRGTKTQPDQCLRAQIYGTCVASANSPAPLVARGLHQWLDLGAPASTLVLGLPWYGYDYPCVGPMGPAGEVCEVFGRVLWWGWCACWWCACCCWCCCCCRVCATHCRFCMRVRGGGAGQRGVHLWVC